MISVVIATYNGEKHLVEQLDSIRNQTRKPDEVIIQDDCSKDNTANIIKKYICDYKLEGWNFKANKTNKGFFDNFFDAISAANGDTIYLADQDDIWDLNKIKTFESIFYQDEAITMIQSNISFVDDLGNPIESNELYHGKKRGERLIELTIDDMCRFAGSGFTMCFRRTVKDEIISKGLSMKRDIFRFHDILLGQSAIALGKVYLCQSIVDFHRLHSRNVTRQAGRSFLQDRTKKIQMEILEKREQQLRIMEMISMNQDKKIYFKEAALFAKIRYEFIKKFSVRKYHFLICKNYMYASKKGLVTDFMYSIGLEKLLQIIFKYINIK